jgi:Plant protein of unknown function (DUF641).
MTTKTLIQCFLSLIILLGLWFTSAHADDKSMRDELNAMQKKIHAEEETTQKLKEDLAARDKEVAELRQKLKELEEKIGK